MRFEGTCVLTTAAAAPAPSEAQLRIRDSATNAMILQGEQPQRVGGEGEGHTKDKGGWREADESLCSNTSFSTQFIRSSVCCGAGGSLEEG